METGKEGMKAIDVYARIYNIILLSDWKSDQTISSQSILYLFPRDSIRLGSRPGPAALASAPGERGNPLQALG